MATPKTKASVALCTLDDVREWIQKSGGATEAPTDQFLGRLIDRFSMWFETATQREFSFEEYERYYVGTGTTLLWSSVAPIADESDQINPPKYELFDGTAWSDVSSSIQVDIKDEGGAGKLVLISGGVWSKPPSPYANWRITLTAGFAAVPEGIPDEVRSAATIGTDLLLRYQSMGVHVLAAQSNVDGLSWSSRNLNREDRERLKFVFDVVGNYKLASPGVI